MYDRWVCGGIEEEDELGKQKINFEDRKGKNGKEAYVDIKKTALVIDKFRGIPPAGMLSFIQVIVKTKPAYWNVAL